MNNVKLSVPVEYLRCREEKTAQRDWHEKGSFGVIEGPALMGISVKRFPGIHDKNSSDGRD